MQWSFYLDDGYLCVEDLDTQKIHWRGKPDGHLVSQVLHQPNMDYCIVLLAINDGPRFYPNGPRKFYKNLVRCQPDGSIIWRADLPGSQLDIYSEARWGEEGQIIAYSVKGFSVTINIENGKVLFAVFVK